MQTEVRENTCLFYLQIIHSALAYPVSVQVGRYLFIKEAKYSQETEDVEK